MHAWLFAIAAATASGQAVQVPGAPPLPPHLHYEIRVLKTDDLKPTDAQRLQRACEYAREISGHLGKAEKADGMLTFYLAQLKIATCGKAD